MKKLLTVLIAVMMLTAVSAYAEGTLRVGMECGYAPYNWQQVNETEFTAIIADNNGYADGYDVQIAKRIAERKMTIDFTDYYYQSELVVVVRKDGKYANAQSLSDLTGAVICAQLNTFHDTVIDQIPGVIHDMPRETFPAMVVALNSDAIDGYIAERPGAEADIMANPGLTYIAFAEGQGFEADEADTAIAIGIVYGSQYKDAINATLAGISEEERVQIMVDATARQPLVAE